MNIPPPPVERSPPEPDGAGGWADADPCYYVQTISDFALRTWALAA